MCMTVLLPPLDLPPLDLPPPSVDLPPPFFAGGPLVVSGADSRVCKRRKESLRGAFVFIPATHCAVGPVHMTTPPLARK